MKTEISSKTHFLALLPAFICLVGCFVPFLFNIHMPEDYPLCVAALQLLKMEFKSLKGGIRSLPDQGILLGHKKHKNTDSKAPKPQSLSLQESPF